MKIDKSKVIRISIEVLLILVFVVPFIGLSYYTLPRSDDFSAANTARQFGGNNLISALLVTKNMYLKWEGWYSGHFVWALLNPLGFGNSDAPIRIVNLLMFAFFFSTWTYILFNIVKMLDFSKDDSRLITVILLAFSVNCRYIRELIFWFTGFAYYTVQIMCGLFGFIYAIRLVVHDKYKFGKKIGVMSAVIISIIVAVGGSLQISAIMCWLYLLLFAYSIYYKADWKRSLTFFGSSLIFTIVSLFSPGYTHRQDSMGVVQMSPFQAIPLTIQCVFKTLKEILTDTFSPYVFLIIIILLMILIKKTKDSIVFNPIFVALFGIVSIMISTFPVCYGYNGAYMGDRGYEVLTLQVVVWGFLFLYSIANMLLRKGICLDQSGILAVVLVSLVLFSSYSINNISFFSVPSLRCAKQLLDGSTREFSNYWLGTLHEVWYSDEEDVVIVADSKYFDMEEDMMLYRCNLHTDTENWINKAASEFYGHNSISVINSEDIGDRTNGGDQ